MAFDGNEGEVVALRDASSWTRAYRDQMEEGDPKGHFLGRNKLLQILNQDGAKGIRFYYAIEDGQKTLVAVAADADENDLFEGTIVERSRICPPHCGTANDLNS